MTDKNSGSFCMNRDDTTQRDVDIFFACGVQRGAINVMSAKDTQKDRQTCILEEYLKKKKKKKKVPPQLEANKKQHNAEKKACT